jgi:hypothetical protein
VKPGGRLGELAKIRQARGDRTKLMPLMREQALAEFGPDEDRDPFVIHPSEMAKADWCIRATYYRISGKPEPERKFNFVLENIFATGNDSHVKYQRWLRGTGKLYGVWVCRACQLRWEGVSGELAKAGCYGFPDKPLLEHVWEYREVQMRSGLIAGRADGGVGAALAEVKTIGLGTLRIDAPELLGKYYHADVKLYDLDKLWRELARPLPSHIRQASVYLWLAREMGLPFTQMNFLYEFKANQQTREFVITLSDSVIEPLLEKARLIEVAIAAGVPPECEFGGCKECQAYEGEDVDGKPAPGEQGPDRKARRVVTGGRTRSGEAAARTSAPTRRRTTTGTSRADRAGRPGADGAVRAAEPVGRISRRSAQHGSGRRTVRRQAG